MGRKVHPYGFRIGTIRDWQAKWHADKHYAEFLQEDLKLRKAIGDKYAEAGVSLVEIERQANKVSVTIYTARPGIVIGRGGQRVDEMRRYLEDLIGKRVQLNIQEIRQPELDAYLVARAVAEQMERRVAYRRVMKQTLFRTMQAGAKGMKISCAGRLGGAEIARRQTMHQGQVPLHTLRADIDYGFTEARTTLGRIGVKVWIYRGDILPEAKEEVAKEAPAEAAAGVSAEVEPTVAAKPEEKPAEAIAAEAAPEAKAEKKPAKPKAKRVARAKPAAKPEEKPAEAVAAEAVEVVPEAKAEKKPAKPKAKRVARAKPAAKPEEAVAAEAAEVVPEAKAEKKPAKPRAKRVARAKPAVKPEEKPAEAVAAEAAEVVPEAKAEKKPAKPKAKRVPRAKPTKVKEDKDATA